jgi:beta-glucuronidase
MLRPVVTRSRDLASLDGVWRFAVDTGARGLVDEWWAAALPGRAEIAVPASYNDLFPDAAVREHVGDVWYQREVVVSPRWDGRRVVLRFDSVTHEAQVWWNDQEVVSHVGGYTPFEVDLTAVATPGEVARLTVRVNNELSMSTVPPGIVDEVGDRSRQRYFHDFFNYSGVHRSVWLYSTPEQHISDVTVRTEIESGAGIVHYDCVVVGDGRTTVDLLDGDGVQVASGQGPRGTLRVEGARLWRPGEGYLYRLVVTCRTAEGDDEYQLPVGIRTIEVDARSVRINGEPFYFTGFGWHEDADVRGKGHDSALMVHDFALLEWFGANSIRTSHYPYAEEVLDYADRHGIVVIDETPAVGLNARIALFTGSSEGDIFGEGGLTDEARQAHRRVIQELVDRDKNHPSVVMWSIANEPDAASPGARLYFEPLVELTRELDPSRPVCHAGWERVAAADDQISDLFDVLCVNRYFGWYIGLGDLETARATLAADLTEWHERFGKPVIVTEYGADAYPGLRSFVDTPWSEDFQKAFLDAYHEVFSQVPAVVGEQVWAFADFATAAGLYRVDGNRKGVLTRNRKPKAAAFALREHWRALPGWGRPHGPRTATDVRPGTRTPGLR